MEIDVNIGGGYTIDVSENFTKGKDGKDGKSAYEIWKEEPGNEDKTEQEFLDSLKGEDGRDGINGQDGADGVDGKSAYEIWKELGNEGDEQQFINSLKGDPGEKGEPGTTTWAGITDKPDVYTKAESDRKYARITIVTWED